MGLLIEASESYPARPRYFDALDTFDAADGQVLYVVFKRRRDLLYYVCRYVYMGVRVCVRLMKVCGLLREGAPEPQNPNPWEIQLLTTEAETAELYIESKVAAAKREGRSEAYQYGPLWVNRAFPDDPTKWRGLVRKTTLWRWRKSRASPLPARQPLLVMVDEAERRAELRELEEWRAGRRETESNTRLREVLQAAFDTQDKCAQLEARVAALEAQKGVAKVATNGAKSS